MKLKEHTLVFRNSSIYRSKYMKGSTGTKGGNKMCKECVKMQIQTNEPSCTVPI